MFSATNWFDVSAIRSKVWDRVKSLASSNPRAIEALDKQYAAVQKFYTEVTTLPVTQHWSHEMFYRYDPSGFSKRSQPAARVLVMLDGLRVSTVYYKSTPWENDVDRIKTLKGWALGVLMNISPGGSAIADLNMKEPSIVDDYIKWWADSHRTHASSPQLQRNMTPTTRRVWWRIRGGGDIAP